MPKHSLLAELNLVLEKFTECGGTAHGGFYRNGEQAALSRWQQLLLFSPATATATELPLPLDRRAGNEQITVERGEFRNKHLYLSGFSGRVGGRRLV